MAVPMKAAIRGMMSINAACTEVIAPERVINRSIPIPGRGVIAVEPPCSAAAILMSAPLFWRICFAEREREREGDTHEGA